MKRTNIYLIIVLINIAGFLNNSLAQSFYDINTIQTISITFSQSNWDYMLDTAKAGSDGYLMAQSVNINGTIYDSVGVKYKGNSTYNPNYVKNPFHIELDTYKEQDYQGYKDIKLSNVAKDPSFLREVLSYSILRKYMNASLSNYANVSVNGTLIGLYVSSESIGKTFVNKNFYSKDNTFFKCNPIDGAGPGSTDLPNLVYLGTDSIPYYPAYELKSDYGWMDLITLTNTLKNNIGSIENVLDVDRALWMLAFDNLLVNLDSYIGVFTQNYYLYKDNTGRFNSIVWDLNESFGTFSQTGTINLPNTTAKSQMTHLLHSGDANWPLVQKLLSVPTYKKMYLAHLHTILTENFSNNSYYTLAQSIRPIINAAVQADPNKFFTYAQYQSNLTTDVGTGPSSAPGITALMNGRNTYLSALPDFTNTKPTITNVAPSDTNPTLNTSIFITANVINTNAGAVYLGYRDNNENRFTKVLMYDDGAHGDGTAGDNVYGASIVASSSSIQYYIYAENNNVGMFSPVRAEHEFYSINVNSTTSSDVVMNEIYSRGTTTDPDWIELYNSSASAIDISGYKIYDSGGQTGTKPKKEFPTGTVIPLNGFLVIVTDDTSASGFGLSSSGEKVWLENASGLIADSVTFPSLTVAQSYGRIPDGGSWQTLDTITRGVSNNTTVSNDALMNEIYSRGTTADPDWIEIYNTSTSALDISGYKIYDSGGQSGTKPKKEFPSGSVIPSNGFLVIVTDDTTSSGFGLSSSGEKVWLENTVGLIADSVTFPALTVAQSYGRTPDGGDWQTLDTITRGVSNIPFSPNTFQLSVLVTGGWNMVSAPGAHPTDQNVTTWWSGKDPAAGVFRYSSGYLPVSATTPGQGYWMKNLGPNTYNTGDEWPAGGINIVAHHPITGASGWNLIGGYEISILTSGITTTPAGLQTGNVFGYSSGYIPATHLVPGYGYWIKLTAAGSINIPSVLFNGPSKLVAANDDWGKIIITDNSGKSYTLYSVNSNSPNGGASVNLNDFELPPAPPTGMFDVRFGSGRYAEELSSAAQIIELNSLDYPVRVRTENASLWLHDETGKIVNEKLKAGEEVVISSNSINKLLVSADIIPDVYSLEQNYPNPFNPSTKIEFSIPENVNNATLTIYNALGQRVAELINSKLEAGYYSYVWNANNVATGMYIYELRTDKFVSVKKMILLK